MDLNKVRERLQGLQNTAQEGKNVLWKPEEGINTVRIIPYVHNPEYPFLELLFHYEVGKKIMLSPATFGEPDPIVEFAEKLKSSGNKEDWALGRKLEPKMRVYAPILVRGAEQEGVKFWGFGKIVYQEILGFISDVDYGDITDPMNGRDITIDYKKGTKAGEFASTSIRVKPNITPATTDPQIIELMSNQPKLVGDIFKVPTYEELKESLMSWLNPEKSEEKQEDKQRTMSPSDTVGKTTQPPVTEGTSDISEAFKKLFQQ